MRNLFSPLLALAAVLLIAGCAKNHLPESLQPEAGKSESGQAEAPKTPLQIDLQIGQGGGTKAVKTGWEVGDMVMVFFPGLADSNKSKYLTVVYTVNKETGIPKWEASPMSTAPDVEDLEASGSMTALFLPYGKGVTASWNVTENKYVLSRLDYAYFLRAENVTYTVENSTLKGTLDMNIPDGYVQFFIPITPEDPSSAEAYHDEGAWYTLRQDHLIPTCAARIAADGSVKTYLRPPGESIDGFYYAGGYQFCGVLKEAASGVQQDYWFTLTNNSLSRNFTLFRSGKTLTGGNAVRLPAATGWQEVGADKWVDLGYGTEWASCNRGASFPTETGSLIPRKISVGPSMEEYSVLTRGTSQYAMSVHGINGMVFKSKMNNNAIFLPFAGYRSFDSPSDVGIRGYYCCRDQNTTFGLNGVGRFYFTIPDLQIKRFFDGFEIDDSDYRYTVRLCRASPGI